MCAQRRGSDFDFANDVPALLSLVQSEELFSFSHVRASTGTKMSFFRQVRHPQGLRVFREKLGGLSNSFQHVLSCFMMSQMRWCFLPTPRRFCPHCSESWHWEHFLQCPHLMQTLSSRGLSLVKMHCDVLSSNWSTVFADIAHVLVVWSFLLNVDPNLLLN